MKIAVCLSGQPRTIEYTIPSIQAYFSGEHEYDFFCHAWNYNTDKKLKENPEPGEQPVYWGNNEHIIEKDLVKSILRLNPKKYTIHSEAVLENNWFPWCSLFYSMMYANHLKKEYEIENNFRYDLVIKSRYDIIYAPNEIFTLYENINKNNELDIFYGHVARAPCDYMRRDVSDAFFYGSSLVMDLMCDVFRDCKSRSFTKSDDRENLGPGSSMVRYGEDRNIASISIPYGWNLYTVYRSEIAPADAIKDYYDINNYNSRFYQVIKKND